MQGSNGVAIPAGATAVIEVTALKRSENANDNIEMEFAVKSIAFNGKTYAVNSTVTSAQVDKVRNGDASNDAKKVATGAVIGAIAGQIFGHHTKSTVIGAAVGLISNSVYEKTLTERVFLYYELLAGGLRLAARSGFLVRIRAAGRGPTAASSRQAVCSSLGLVISRDLSAVINPHTGADKTQHDGRGDPDFRADEPTGITADRRTDESKQFPHIKLTTSQRRRHQPYI